ncbi:DNA replication protein DnaC, partial [Escherichia coli]
MKNVGDLMQRLQKMMPAHIKPAFKTGEELLAWQKEQGAIRSAALEREICNELLLRGKSVLIITVADIMSAMKDTFRNSGTSEEQLLN